MISMTEARERVARGAAHLDVVRPGWFNRIDVGTLTLHDPCGCIVGQLTGNIGMEEGLDALGVNPDGDDDEAYGLELHLNFGSPVLVLFRPLQDAWIEAIADRRLSTASNGTPACDAVPVRPTVEVAVSSR